MYAIKSMNPEVRRTTTLAKDKRQRCRVWAESLSGCGARVLMVVPCGVRLVCARGRSLMS